MIQRRSVLAGVGACAGVAALPSVSWASCPVPTVSGALGRGFHLGEVLHRPRRDFDDMAAAGANLTRFGIALREAPDGSGYEWPAAAVEELSATLEQARRLAMRVVPVLRPPPEPNSKLWRQPIMQSSLNDIWKRLARSLKGNEEVAAFDLVNEPHPNGPNFAAKEKTWAELAGQLIQTIRNEDRGRAIVYEPSPGARPMGFRYVQPLPFENIIYSVHFYEPFEFTHQRTGDSRFSETIDFPSNVAGEGRWDTDRLEKELAPIRDFQARTGGRPIYVGEFGVARWAPDGARERYLTALTALFNKYGWSWTFHAFREWQGWDAEMNDVERSRSRSPSSPAFEVLREALRAC